MGPALGPSGDYPRRLRRSLCRFPRCNKAVFFDRRVNEPREWCSHEHMQSAVHICFHNPVLSYLSLELR